MIFIRRIVQGENAKVPNGYAATKSKPGPVDIRLCILEINKYSQAEAYYGCY